MQQEGIRPTTKENSANDLINEEKTRNVLVVGAHGVVGRAVAEHFAAHPAWEVTTASRRGPLEDLQSVDGGAPSHVSVDLLDAKAASDAFAQSSHITHLVYAAYAERPTMAETTAPNVAMLSNTLDALAKAGAELERVILIGGGKSYGEHLGPYKVPAKEHHPRLLGPIFYNNQEDLLRERSEQLGYGWTVLRPDAVIGLSTGSPMNLLTCIAVFASLSKAAGVPLRFPGKPGTWTALHQITDAALVARASEWALTSPAANREIFNVTNGDLFRWQDLWEDIATFFDMPAAAPQPMPLTEQMSDKEAAWDRLVNQHGLRRTPWSQIASWPFAEAVFDMDFNLVQSTIKIRKAGFTDCEDSHESFLRNLSRLCQERFIP